MIKELEQSYPNHFCLRRHFLESIRRIASLAPHQIESAKKRSLESPKAIVKNLFRIHSLGFWTADFIDSMAIPLQNDGLTIICRDVPPIPFGEKEETLEAPSET